MLCTKCDSKLEKAKTSKLFSGNIVVEDIETLRCTNCGEEYFDESSYEKTLKKVKEIKSKIPGKLMNKIKTITL
ncbi:MAG: YgiT-type zinc finger protein [Candidatus Diapherotrites archaeon]